MDDFNTILGFDPPHIQDECVSSSTHTDRDLLQQLTRAQDLIALHCKQQYASTFEHGSHHSRIDYVFVRQHQVQFRRMHPTMDRKFMRNFGCLGPHHHPLYFVQSRWFAPRKPMLPFNNIDRFAIRTARSEHTPHWQLFEVQIRQCIARHSPPHQPIEVSMHALEQELRTICSLFFPKRKSRVPQAPHIPSMAIRMWNARKQALVIRGRTTRDLFECWAHVTTFRTLHKAIRKRNRQNKRDKLHTILAEGIDLALHGRIFDWYRKIRLLCPKQQTRRIQLFDPHGMPLAPQQELISIEQYYTNLFADPHFGSPELAPLTKFPFDRQDVFTKLLHLPSTKALAPDGLPALIWKHFAHDLVDPLMHQIHQVWLSRPIHLPVHWTTGWIHLLPKPNKSPSKPQALRPICLQHPVNKILAGIQCKQIIQQTFDRLRCLPLYAYLPHRGTRECLLIVAEHCRTVRMMCKEVKIGSMPKLLGDLQISLDMEKAFDTVSRTLVLRTLKLYHLDPDLFQLVHLWLTPHKYCIPFKQLIGQIQAHRGIKQGAKNAPLLWTLTMSLVLIDLQTKYSHTWLHEHMGVYADDIHLKWIIRSTAQALEAFTDLQHVLMTLQAFGFNGNLQKSVAMLRLQGKEAPAFLRHWVSRPDTGPVLTLPERRWQLPLVSKTAYLGVIIGYRAWFFDTTARRITAAKWCFRNLRSWLVNDVHPIRTRLKFASNVFWLLFNMASMKWV